MNDFIDVSKFLPLYSKENTVNETTINETKKDL